MSDFSNGNSGQKLKFLSESQIVKIFPDNERSQNQIKKQNAFCMNSCEILKMSTFSHNHFLYSLMPYVKHDINFILENHRESLKQFLLSYFFELKEKNKEIKNVQSLVISKFQSLDSFIDPFEYSLIFKSLCSKNQFIVPSSKEAFSCHGDFTFSNILFKDNRYVLIDCLDSFLESFLIDYCKIQQDLIFNYWKYKQIIDPAYSTILKDIQKILDESFSSYIKQFEYEYHVLNLLTVYRIFPYANQSLISKLTTETNNYIQKNFQFLDTF